MEKYDRKHKKLDAEQQTIRDEYANRQKIISQDAEEESDQMKEKIQRDMQQEWEDERRRLDRDL